MASIPLRRQREIRAKHAAFDDAREDRWRGLIDLSALLIYVVWSDAVQGYLHPACAWTVEDGLEFEVDPEHARYRDVTCWFCKRPLSEAV